ncbi:hypothetical protein ACUOBA_49130, partial [Escherichia coli]
RFWRGNNTAIAATSIFFQSVTLFCQLLCFLLGKERTDRLSRGINKPVATLVTQVEVDANDPAFLNPTKPIGSFFTEQEAEQLTKQGYTLKEDAGRGYRRVVASPKP